MRSLFWLCFFLFFSMFSVGQAQKLSDLEAITKKGDIVFFDYRLHRNPAYIYRHLLTNDSVNDFHLVHLYRGNVIYSPKANTPNLKYPEGFYKVDLQIEPYYSARFGGVEDPFQTQVGIGPRIQLNSKKGLYGVFQWLIPLQNDFIYELNTRHRPGEIGFGYSHIANQRNFINSFAGVFNNSRYGIYGEYIRMNRRGTFYYGGAAYYTGPYIFYENTFIRERMNYFSGYVFGAYRLTGADITFQLTAERFLYEDYGVTVEIMRQFGNTDIGFFGKKTKLGENAGVFVAVSLWPRKFYSNRFLQVRLPNSFGFRYDLRAAIQAGRQVRPQSNFFYDLLRFNPNYIHKQLKMSGLTNEN